MVVWCLFLISPTIYHKFSVAWFDLSALSHDMTKPTQWPVRSDQSLRCPHEAFLGPQLHTERTAKPLIRLGGCPGWSEASLGAHSFCWFCHVAAHLFLPKTPNGNGTQTPWAQAESQETDPFRVDNHQAIPNKEHKTSGTNWKSDNATTPEQKPQISEPDCTYHANGRGIKITWVHWTK